MKKILIVDDEPQFLELLKEKLIGRYRVVAALDGESGIQMALDEKPDLILSDILMPHMDGYEMLEALQKHGETKNIPFIMLTAVEDTSSIYKAKDYGVTDYLIKPAHLEELTNLLKRYLG